MEDRMNQQKYKPGTGVLFRNDKKETERHPDYTGSVILPDGTEHWLSAWIKEGKKGKYMSLSIGETKQAQTSTERHVSAVKRLHGR